MVPSAKYLPTSSQGGPCQPTKVIIRYEDKSPQSTWYLLIIVLYLLVGGR